MQNIDLATLVIIASTVIITLIGFKDRSFFEKYKFNIAGIKKGEKVRLFLLVFYMQMSIICCLTC